MLVDNVVLTDSRAQAHTCSATLPSRGSNTCPSTWPGAGGGGQSDVPTGVQGLCQPHSALTHMVVKGLSQQKAKEEVGLG